MMSGTVGERRSLWSVTRKLLAVVGVLVTLGFVAEAGTLLTGQETELREAARFDGRMLVRLLGVQMSGGLRWKKAEAVEATYTDLVKEGKSGIAAVLVLDETGHKLASYKSGALSDGDLAAIPATEVSGAEPQILRETHDHIIVGTAVVAGKDSQR